MFGIIFFYVEKVYNYIYESVNTVLRIQSNVEIVVHTIRVVILLWWVTIININVLEDIYFEQNKEFFFYTLNWCSKSWHRCFNTKKF